MLLIVAISLWFGNPDLDVVGLLLVRGEVDACLRHGCLVEAGALASHPGDAYPVDRDVAEGYFLLVLVGPVECFGGWLLPVDPVAECCVGCLLGCLRFLVRTVGCLPGVGQAVDNLLVDRGDVFPVKEETFTHVP